MNIIFFILAEVYEFVKQLFKSEKYIFMMKKNSKTLHLSYEISSKLFI